jgi:hypothetical protein
MFFKIIHCIAPWNNEREKGDGERKGRWKERKPEAAQADYGLPDISTRFFLDVGFLYEHMIDYKLWLWTDSNGSINYKEIALSSWSIA